MPPSSTSCRAEDGSLHLRLKKEIEALIFECVGSQGYLRIYDRLSYVQCPVIVARGRVNGGAHAMLAETAAVVAQELPKVG